MSTLFPVSGCKIYIGGVKSNQDADFVEADFSAVTWTQIKGWSTSGAFGDTAQVITTSLIDTGRDVKQKGTANSGQMQNVFAFNALDAGQIALLSASSPSDKNNYAFKVELNDAVASGAPSKRYFVGLVMSAEEANGAANTIRNLNSNVEINSNIVRVAAT